MVDVKVTGDTELFVRFADGETRRVDMSERIASSKVYAALRDPAVFRRARVHKGAGTVVWSDDIDIAPEFLRWGPHLPKGCPCGYNDPE